MNCGAYIVGSAVHVPLLWIRTFLPNQTFPNDRVHFMCNWFGVIHMPDPVRQVVGWFINKVCSCQNCPKWYLSSIDQIGSISLTRLIVESSDIRTSQYWGKQLRELIGELSKKSLLRESQDNSYVYEIAPGTGLTRYTVLYFLVYSSNVQMLPWSVHTHTHKMKQSP